MGRKEEILREIEELKARKHKAESDAKIQDIFQLSFKIYLNSVYGFTGTTYSPVFSKDLAEAVTLTGQSTTKEMVRFTNEKLNELGGTPQETEHIVAGDTDSCSWDTVIAVNGFKMKIAELFDEFASNGKVDVLENGTEVAIPSEKAYRTFSVNGETIINNISRHRVSKDRYGITYGDKTINITKDHSVMIYRNGEVIECKPAEIQETDFLIVKRSEL